MSSGRRRPARAASCRPCAYGCLEIDGARDVPRRHLLAHVAHDEVDDRALGKAEQVADGGDEHVFELRARQHLLQHVREVLEHHDDRRAGVRELVLELAGGVERVGVDDDEAGAQRAEHGDRILQGVRQHDGDAVALLEAPPVCSQAAKARESSIELRDR